MINLSECEEQVMVVIWMSDDALDLQPIRIGVNTRFNHEWAPQTVSTYLARLIKKGYLRMERKGRNKYYYPKIVLGKYRQEKMQNLVKRLYDGNSECAIECLREVQS